ncbi:MAG: flagellar motor switch protein FliM [Nitrospiria bacterium]
MADKILSQGEVEALVKGVKEGEVDTQVAEGPASGVRGYDLTNQDRIINRRMPSLEIINERFARLFQASLSSFLRKEVAFAPGSVDILKFGEFTKKIPPPSNINVIKMDPLRGHTLIVFDAKAVYRLVDLYFGGKGQTDVKIEGREFTTIEQRIARKIVTILLEDFERAWKPLHPVKILFARAETNPQFASVVAPTEVAIQICFKLEVEGEGGEVFVCLPYPTIEPIRDKLYSSFQSDQPEVDGKWGERFRTQLFNCNLSVTAEIGDAILTLDEVIHLSVGDIIVLNKNVSGNLGLKVEGRPKFYGRAGIYQGNRALQITSLIANQ